MGCRRLDGAVPTDAGYRDGGVSAPGPTATFGEAFQRLRRQEHDEDRLRLRTTEQADLSFGHAPIAGALVRDAQHSIAAGATENQTALNDVRQDQHALR